MSVRCLKTWVFYESCTGEGINPEYLGINKEEIESYIKEHPMPEDPAYSIENLIGDISGSSGVLLLPPDTKEETADYVADLINYLWN